MIRPTAETLAPANVRQSLGRGAVRLWILAASNRDDSANAASDTAPTEPASEEPPPSDTTPDETDATPDETDAAGDVPEPP